MSSAATKLAPQKDNSRRDQLILENLSLVTAIAVRVHGKLPVHIELDDMINAGIVGLFDAATKYAEDKQVSFSAYAKHRIKGAILDSLRDLDWASRDLRRRHKQLETVTRDLTTRLDRDPSEAEIATEMGITPRRFRSLMVDLRNINAAAQSQSQDREDQIAPEMPCSSEQHPDKMYAFNQLRDKLTSALKTMPARYQQVVEMYYYRDLTMKEIGEMLGVNESRVSQIHKIALERMQSALGECGVQSAACF